MFPFVSSTLAQYTTQYGHSLYRSNGNLVGIDDVIRSEGEGSTQESRGGRERGMK